MAADHTVAACGVCGRPTPVDALLRLRPVDATHAAARRAVLDGTPVPAVAHCPRCIDAWRKRFEAKRQGGMK